MDKYSELKKQIYYNFECKLNEFRIINNINHTGTSIIVRQKEKDVLKSIDEILNIIIHIGILDGRNINVPVCLQCNRKMEHYGIDENLEKRAILNFMMCPNCGNTEYVAWSYDVFYGDIDYKSIKKQFLSNRQRKESGYEPAWPDPED